VGLGRVEDAVTEQRVELLHRWPPEVCGWSQAARPLEDRQAVLPKKGWPNKRCKRCRWPRRASECDELSRTGRSSYHLHVHVPDDGFGEGEGDDKLNPAVGLVAVSSQGSVEERVNGSTHMA
jgi:hypothetical protein